MQIFGYFQRFSYSYFARLALISEIAETIQARCGKPESIGPFANRSFRKKSGIFGPMEKASLY